MHTYVCVCVYVYIERRERERERDVWFLNRSNCRLSTTAAVRCCDFPVKDPINPQPIKEPVKKALQGTHSP